MLNDILFAKFANFSHSKVFLHIVHEYYSIIQPAVYSYIASYNIIYKGVPVIVVGTAVGIAHDDYGNEE